MTRWKLVLGLCALSALVLPSRAFAQAFVNVSYGSVTGPSVTGTQQTWTGDIGGFFAGGWFGVDGDLGYTPKIDGVSQRFRTLSASLLVGPEFGQLHPYGSIGYGIMGNVDSFVDSFKFSNSVPHQAVMSYGGGLVASLTDHIGFRVDIRIFRDPKTQLAPEETRFKMTRTAFGLAVMF